MGASLQARAVAIVLVCAVAFLIPLKVAAAESGAPAHSRETAVAQLQLPQLPQLPNLAAPAADWREWDSFFTFIVGHVGQDLSGNLRDALAEAFLDSRYELSSFVAQLGAGQNPVPQLFTNA